jgi:hypothetical protein
MHFLVETPEHCADLLSESERLLMEALEGAPGGEELTIKASEDIAGICVEKNCYLLITEGNLKLSCGGNLFVLLEENDIIGLDHQIKLQGSAITAELAIKARIYDRKALSDFFKQNPDNASAWERYLDKQMSLFFLLTTHFSQGGLETDTEVESFEEGQVIIEQGSRGKEVYHMLQGAADVLVDGVKVGEVKENEVFGALAALTSSERSATVKASKDSTIIKVPEEQFLALIRSRPATVLTLIQDMARSITSLNEKVVEMSKLGG